MSRHKAICRGANIYDAFLLLGLQRLADQLRGDLFACQRGDHLAPTASLDIQHRFLYPDTFNGRYPMAGFFQAARLDTFSN
ncbi:Uncharacterised protein [Klebsiella pneumoniae]|nr:Uncharacterised protein [Klebsiella pneumoniae]